MSEKRRIGQVQHSAVYYNRRTTRRKEIVLDTQHNTDQVHLFLFVFVSSCLSIDPFYGRNETMPPSGSLLFFLESPSSPPLAGPAVPVQPTAQASADNDTSTTTTVPATDAAADDDDHYQTKSYSYLQQRTQQPQPPQQPIHLNLNMATAVSSTHTTTTKQTLPTRSVLETHVQPMDETLRLQSSRTGILPDLMIDSTSTLSTSSPQSSSSSSLSPKRKSCMLRSSSISSVDSNSSSTSESSSSSDDSGNSSYLNSYVVSPTLLKATTSSKRTSPRRRVFFNTEEPADVCEIIHVSEYTDQERMSAWYNYYDLRSFKRERRETARRIEEHQRRRRDQQMCHHSHRPIQHHHHHHQHHVDGDDCEDSIRGVESLTESGSRLRSAFIVDGINAVLNEQDLQDQDGTCNPDMLAHVYRSKCEPSRRVAHERALIDQQEARRLYREDKEEEKRKMQQINIDVVTNQGHYDKEMPVVKSNEETSMVISSSPSPSSLFQHDNDETMKTIDLFSPSPQDNNNFQLTLTELETS